MKNLAVTLIATSCLFACSSSIGDEKDGAYALFVTMDPSQQSWYMQGSLAMLVLQFAYADEKARGQCAYDWYYETPDTSLPAIFNAIEKNRTVPFSYILSELVKMECPAESEPPDKLSEVSERECDKSKEK